MTGVPRALDSALADARAAGFNAVRIFLRWDRIETTTGAPDWACRYVTDTDLGPDADGDGIHDPWPGIPCNAGPCGCPPDTDLRWAGLAALKDRLRDERGD